MSRGSKHRRQYEWRGKDGEDAHAFRVHPARAETAVRVGSPRFEEDASACGLPNETAPKRITQRCAVCRRVIAVTK